MARREIGTRWDRENRNNINENFKELYDVQDRAIEEATQAVIDSAKLIWLEPVDTFADIPTTYPNPEVGHTVFVRDTGKVYRFYDGAWMEIQQIDAGPVNEVDTRLSAEIEENRQEIEQARTKADGTTFPVLRDRLNDVDDKIGILKGNTYHIKEFGAKGDGVNNDAQAFIDAYNALSDGDTLKLHSGKFKVINLPRIEIRKKNITIEGEGKWSTIIDARNSSDFMFWIKSSGVIIKNLGIEKNFATTDNIGIFQPIYITEYDSSTGETYNVENVLIDNVYIKGGIFCIQVGANVNPNEIHGTLKNVIIQNCELYSNEDGTRRGGCIHGRYGEDCKFINNFCYGGGAAAAINLYKISKSIVQGNSIYRNKWAGIESENNSGGNIITNNNIFDCEVGVMIDDTKKNIISDNNITTTNESDLIGIRVTSRSDTNGSLHTDIVKISNNTIYGYRTGIMMEGYDVPEHANAKIKNIIIRNNEIVGCRTGIQIGNGGTNEFFGYISKVRITGNTIEYNNEIQTTVGIGVYVSKFVDDILIKNNFIRDHSEGINVDYQCTSEKIFIEDNDIAGSAQYDIRVYQSAGKVFLKDNIVEKEVRFLENKFLDGTHVATGNISRTNKPVPNRRYGNFGSLPEKGYFKNNTASTIPKGTIVILDYSETRGTFIKVSSLKNSTQIIGVANENIAAGAYGEVITRGYCEVLVNGAVNAGDIMTNNMGNAEKIASSSDREVLIALESNSSGIALKKALFVNRR